jgi:hypothetical protein
LEFDFDDWQDIKSDPERCAWPCAARPLCALARSLHGFLGKTPVFGSWSYGYCEVLPYEEHRHLEEEQHTKGFKTCVANARKLLEIKGKREALQCRSSAAAGEMGAAGGHVASHEEEATQEPMQACEVLASAVSLAGSMMALDDVPPTLQKQQQSEETLLLETRHGAEEDRYKCDVCCRSFESAQVLSSVFVSISLGNCKPRYKI